MKIPLLSIVIPAHNEKDCIAETVIAFNQALKNEQIRHEILVINDNSSDGTEKIVANLGKKIKEIKLINNSPPNGFGFAVRKGLSQFKGDYIAIVMADLSDNPDDLITMFKLAVSHNYDCVFGSRFNHNAKVKDYPLHKLLLNRLTNNIIKLLFVIRYNDVTNAFKLYSKNTIMGLKPFLSHHFNLTVELPLKAIIRGYNYGVVPTDWTNRKSGISKLKIREMGSRYFFIILYCFLEKLLAMGDYKKSEI